MTDIGNNSTTPWSNGQSLPAVDFLDTLYSNKFLDIIHSGQTSSISGFCAHSETTWSFIGSDGETYQTSNSGTSWTNRSSSGLTSTPVMVVCQADKTHAFAFDYTQVSDVIFTDDSGATWTAKTQHTWGIGGNPHDVSFATTGLIVMAGDDAANAKHIHYSTNDGGTWLHPTTSPGLCYAVSMFSATTGFALDSSSNIWKTVDGCDNWTNTGHNVLTTPVAKSTMLALSATTFMCSSSGVIEYYDASGDSTIILKGQASTTSGGIIKNSSGHIYVLLGGIDATPAMLELYKTTDTGTTWTFIPTGLFISVDTKHKMGYFSDSIVIGAKTSLIKINGRDI